MTPGPYDYIELAPGPSTPAHRYLVRGDVRAHTTGTSHRPIALVRDEADARAIVRALAVLADIEGCALLKEQAG